MGVMFVCPYTFGHVVHITIIEIMLKLNSLIVLTFTGKY